MTKLLGTFVQVILYILLIFFSVMAALYPLLFLTDVWVVSDALFALPSFISILMVIPILVDLIKG